MYYRLIFCWAFLLPLCLPVLGHSSSHDVLGINEHFAKYSDYNASIDEVIASGTKWVRIGLHWGRIETAKGVYDQSELNVLDAIITRLHDEDVNVLFILGYTAQWASSQPSAPWSTATRVRPASWSDWEDFVTFITARYQGKVTHWEVWNEPDHSGFWKSSVADYVTLLEKAAAIIRTTDPQNAVLMGGLAMTDGTNSSFGPGTFFDMMMIAGAGPYFDIVNYHAYGPNEYYVTLHQGIKEVMALHGIDQRPIWLTETGYTTNGVTAKEMVKADVVEQTYLAHLKLGIEKMFWYVYRNPVVYDENGLHDLVQENFGLVSNNRTPFPAFYRYQSLDGARTDFAMQKNYPQEIETFRTLTHVNALYGDGSYITDYDASGSSRKIAENTYMYLRVQDQWLFQSNAGLNQEVVIEVTYLDQGTGVWSLQYDSQNSAYDLAGTCQKADSGEWKTERFFINDVWFSNRQNNASDFRLLAAVDDLVVSEVMLRRPDAPQAATVLGADERYFLIERAIDNDPTHEAYTQVSTAGGESCLEIGADNRYLYFDVGSGVVWTGDTHLIITIRYWDDGGKFHIQYNSLSSVNKTLVIHKSGTMSWREVDIELTDADFTNALSYHSDFRIGNGYDGSKEYISRVKVSVLDQADGRLGPSSSSGFYVEAEDLLQQDQAAPFIAVSAPDAHQGQAVVVPNGSGNMTTPDASANGLLWIPFQLSEVSDIEIWLREMMPSGSDDSVWIRLDQGSWNLVSFGEHDTTFRWKKALMLQDIAAGIHNLCIQYREDGAYLDAIRILSPGYVNFNTTSSFTYDSSQDHSGGIMPVLGGNGLQVEGNTWKALPFPYEVTPSTVLEFDVTSSDLGEFVCIGLDEDKSYGNAVRLFQLGGIQSSPAINMDFHNRIVLNSKTHIVIPVGQYYTGQMNHLVFIGDDDADASINCIVENLAVRESTSATWLPLGNQVYSSYHTGQDIGGSLTSVQGDRGILLSGNIWKKTGLNYVVTGNTVLEFTCDVSDAGEILVVGLDNDNDYANGKRLFQLAGAHQVSSSFFQDYYGQSINETIRYRIPIGAYYAGQMNHLVLIGDDDADASCDFTVQDMIIFEDR